VKQVAKEIEETHNLEVSLSEVELFPYQFVNIESQEDIEACRKIAEKLQSHDEFVNLFDNISVPEEK
jgi:transcriptional/translational regulatory protein YebC/TACO1